MRFLSTKTLQLIRRVIKKVKSYHAAKISLHRTVIIIFKKLVHRKRMQKLAQSVLLRYGIKADKVCFVSDSMNTVFKVEADGRRYTLRIHPPNNHSTKEIRAELLWLFALQTDMSLLVPEPIPAKDGTLVQEVYFQGMLEARQIVLFKWLDGTFLINDLSPATMELAGAFMARMHQHAQQFKFPEGVSRPHVKWDEHLWLDESYQSQVLTIEEHKLCVSTARVVLEKVDAFTPDTDYGLVHLDLHYWNYLLYQDEIGAIDFDDCQYAPFLYDMAVPLSYLDQRQDYKALESGFLRGYALVRRLPPHHKAGLELFMVVRAVDMISWVLSWSSPISKEIRPELLESSLARLRRYQDSRIDV